MKGAPSAGMDDWKDWFWNFFSVAVFVLATCKALELVFWFIRHISWAS